ncbi:MAG: Protoporphyrinogen oxidase/Glycine/D-amino acid oxidase (deaminating) [Chloroflexi bacterium]|jgi:protoporphyrinogen oxidase|nr:MAG: Protoporphyrinogen oxidase/Glycine/D-amino acid oxidase (deaminating) [Chloroflexota bacterium]
MKVGIIGGGALGLGAAWELVQQGHQPVVYERAPFLGGQASTFDVGGAPLERAYHHLFTSDTAILELAEEVGLGHKMRWIDSKMGIFRNGKIYKFVTPTDLLKFSAIPLIDRIRMGFVALYLSRYKNWRKLENVTASDWIRKYAGPRAYDAVWGPLLRGKFGEYYDKVAMPWFWGKMHTRFTSRGKGMAKEKLGYPGGSFGEIFDRTAELIREKGGEVHIDAGVNKVLIEDGVARGLEVELPGQGAKEENFDVVLATVPSYIFPKLVPPLPADYLAKLEGIKYLAAVLIVLELDQPLSSVYWLNIADNSIPFVGVIEHTNFIEPEVYGGNHIVYIANYLSSEHPLFHMKDTELLEEYLPHLQRINPNFDRSWIRKWHYHRVAAAQPVVEVNYSQRIPDFQTPFDNLYLANTTQIYPEDRGTNYSVRLGREMANRIISDHKGD